MHHINNVFIFLLSDAESKESRGMAGRHSRRYARGDAPGHRRQGQRVQRLVEAVQTVPNRHGRIRHQRHIVPRSSRSQVLQKSAIWLPGKLTILKLYCWKAKTLELSILTNCIELFN